jgi:hypothetical protein
MAELAAAGLASSIVTFLDVSARVVQRLAEYHLTAKAAPSVFRQIATELPLINDILRRTKHECDAAIAAPQGSGAVLGGASACSAAAATAATASGPTSASMIVAAADDAARLAAVVASCHRSVGRLEVLLGKALPLPSDSRSRRTLKALSSVWRERDVAEVERQLARSLQLLTLNFSQRSATMATTAAARVADDEADPLADCFYDVLALRVAHMVRRPLLLATLEKLFGGSAGSATSPASGTPEEPLTVVVLLGLGGQGKTQLALEYCQTARAAKRFGVIVWLDASSAHTAQRGFGQLAAKFAPRRGAPAYAIAVGVPPQAGRRRRRNAAERLHDLGAIVRAPPLRQRRPGPHSPFPRLGSPLRHHRHRRGHLCGILRLRNRNAAAVDETLYIRQRRVGRR